VDAVRDGRAVDAPRADARDGARAHVVDEQVRGVDAGREAPAGRDVRDGAHARAVAPDDADPREGRAPARHEIRAQLLERLNNLPDRMCYWYDRRKPYRAVKLRVPDVPEPHEAAGLTARAFEEFVENSGIRAGGRGLPKAELRQQIETRRRRLLELVRPPVEVLSGVPAVEGMSGATNGHATNGHATNDQAGNSRRPRIG